MGIRTKGRRRIEVEGQAYHWDYRASGRGPGQITADDMYFAPRPAVVRIIAEDKSLLATWDGVHLHVGELRRELRPHHIAPVTPKLVRQLIQEALRLRGSDRDPRITPARWWLDFE
ncbi:hypothetical protein [Enhygromyxa salina]|uniref:Uncharacterized protein n=1 Tax=Enhygromyxa salina TaxID=215803 RepID=A0A2S9XPV6_9BACT|nr:hypothetical protein [Enhygromyxa salina]PRP94899.1 hypothetical protein ENSA7_77220 [Enhygromyxa salina]